MIVVIEGGDQAGKKTQAAMLARALRKAGLKTRVFSFPDYSTPVGRQIEAYLAGRYRPPVQAVHCLLSANRWERLDAINRAIESNSVLIMNRYYHSNLVYGLANGIKLDWLENLDSGLPREDLTILLDITQGESFRRKARGRDQFEKNAEFARKILLTYRRMARKRRWSIVDASRDKRTVHGEIMRLFAEKLGT